MYCPGWGTVRTVLYLTVRKFVHVEVFPGYKVGNSVAFEVSVVVFDSVFGEHHIDHVGSGVGYLAVESCLLVVMFVPRDETAEGPRDVTLGHDDRIFNRALCWR